MPIKNVVLIFSVVIVVVSVSFAQSERASDDKTAVRATVTDYIEAYYLSDATRMERSLHPQYLKHTVSGANGESHIIVKTGMEMVQEVRNKKGSTPISDRKEEINVLSIDGDVASVRLVATQWINYMTLCKQNGEWKILSVVKRNQE